MHSKYKLVGAYSCHVDKIFDFAFNEMHNPISVTKTASTKAKTRMAFLFVMDTRRHLKQSQKTGKMRRHPTAHVLSNLLNELGKRDKMRGLFSDS